VLYYGPGWIKSGPDSIAKKDCDPDPLLNFSATTPAKDWDRRFWWTVHWTLEGPLLKYESFADFPPNDADKPEHETITVAVGDTRTYLAGEAGKIRYYFSLKESINIACGLLCFDELYTTGTETIDIIPLSPELCTSATPTFTASPTPTAVFTPMPTAMPVKKHRCVPSQNNNFCQ
jgi:hypothetical protein